MKRYPIFFIWLFLFWGTLNNLISSNRNNSTAAFEIGLLPANQSTDEALEEASKDALVLQQIYATRQQIVGKIGISAKNTADNPFDNVFEIFVEDSLNATKAYSLQYEVFGVTALGVVRSINDELAFGGRLITFKNEWQSVKEALHVAQLKAGKNIIRFSTPDGADYGYSVRNIRLVAENSTSATNEMVLFGPYQVGDELYMRGFAGKQVSDVSIEQQAVLNFAGAFEYQVKAPNGGSKIEVVATTSQKVIRKNVKAKKLKHQLAHVYDLSLNAVYNKVLATKDQNWALKLDGIQIAGLKESVTEDKEISVTSLRAMDMAPMGPGMINVTAFASGYRLLPHDSKFLNNLQISIGIDSTKLPVGYSPKQVRTYFFDEKTNKWTVLQRDTIQANGMYASALTDHFTDFINAIIKQPELPTSQAYTPTMFSDLKAANPLEGVNTIAPPSANNNGTANISLPIEVPAGRQGLQPQLALQYSSESSTGWLGLGWSLNIPSINVDTRWGVPRYLPGLESESYMMSGEEMQWIENDTLIHPLFHRSDMVARNTNSTRRFVLRVEGKFHKIERHGTSPSNYWWEVKDKSGTTYYYGKYSNDNAYNPNCVLEKNGKIAFWALAEVRDVHGNFMRYFYNVDAFSGRANDPTPGRQLYLDSIEYTGFNQTKGLYKVKFESTNHDTLDVVISARYGFKEVNSRRLKKIKVYYNNRILRSYELVYKTGFFNKRIICFVLEAFRNDYSNIADILPSYRSVCENMAHTTTLPPGVKIHRFFEYGPFSDLEFEYDSLKVTDVDVSITTPSDVKALKSYVSNDRLIDLPFGNDDRKDKSNLLGTSQSFSIGGQGSGYIGLGANPITKNLSLSGSYSLSKNTTRTFVAFMDIDGDGYPDRLFREFNAIFYQKLTYVNGEPTFGAPTFLEGLQSLGSQTSVSNGWGIQGVAGVGPLSGNRSFNYTKTKGTTKAYFTDVDGDGLIDFVDDGKVLFNRLDSTGIPRFALPTSDTLYIGGSCGYIVRKGEINDSIAISLVEDLDPDWDKRMLYHQPVRMWKAPYTGVITIDAPIQLIEDTSYARRQAITPDGVSYTIQLNDNAEFFRGHINAGNYSVVNYQRSNVSVNAGDQLYFRVLPRNSRTWDDVAWAPKITYTSCFGSNVSSSQLNSDAKKAFVFDAAEDFWVYEKRQLRMPVTENVKLHGTISAPPISDTIRFFIRNNAGNIIYQNTLLGNNGFTINLNDTFAVNEDDTLYFGASTNTRIAYEKIEFDLYLDYLAVPGYLDYDINSEFDRIRIRPIVQFQPLNREIRPSLAFTANNNGTHSLTPLLQFNTSVNGSIVMSVKKSNAVVAERSYQVTNGQIPSPSALTYTANIGSAYYYEFHTNDIQLSNALASSQVTLNTGLTNSNTNAGFYGVWNDTLNKFGHLYRGWGCFVYNGDTISKIDQSKLIVLPYFADTNNIKIFDQQSFANDTANILNQTPTQSNSALGNTLDNMLDADFYPMNAFPEDGAYRGIGNLTVIKSNYMSNLFVEPDLIEPHFENPIPVLANGAKPKAVRKTTQQSAWTNGASIGLSSLVDVSGTRATTKDQTLVDFMDLNGDRYPDIVGEHFTQFSLPNGALSQNVVSLLKIHNNKNYSNGEQSSSSRSSNLGGTPMRFEKEKATKGRLSSTGGGNGSGSNSAVYSYIDINGDGLPDKVNSDGEVALNIGYGFEDFVDWGFSDISGSSFSSINLGLNFQKEKGQNSWALGAGLTDGGSTTERIPIDINGDGLIDFLSMSSVWINTGNGFELQNYSSSATTFPKSENFSLSANVSGTFGASVLGFKLGGTASVNLGFTKSYERGQFIDMNNDGFVDFLSANDSTGDIVILYSKIAKYNLLQRVESSTGQIISINYKNIPSSQNMPQSKWVMDSVMVFDGFPGDGRDTTFTTYDYLGGRYDRYERVFLGYDSVITKQHRSIGNVYRTIIEKFHTDDFLFKGLQYENMVLDSIGQRFTAKITTYKKNEILTGAQVNEDSLECFGPYYPAVFREEQKFYEGTSSPIHTKKEYLHGAFGNVIIYRNYGDLSVATDSIRATITYRLDSSAYIVGMPENIKVFVNQGSLIRNRMASYNALGKLTAIRVKIGSDTATTEFVYDQYGNILKQTLPANANNQKVFYQYTYDDSVFMFPVRVQDAYGYSSETKYDFLLSKPIETKDMAGKKVKYTYNANGRLYRIQGPKEIDLNDPFTLQFSYWDDYAHPFPSTYYDRVNLWAKTEHYDAFNAGNTISTVLFADAAGKIIQTKKKSVVEGNDKMIVSGREVYDDFGRAIARYYPANEALGSETTFNPLANTSVNPTRITYDVLDRPIEEKMPDNTETNTTYGFGQDENSVRRFKKTITDANGIAVSVLTDHRELQIKVEAPLSANTNFKYNALGELIESKDPEGNITAYTYDMAGRRTSRTHPDAGVTNWTYDNASNLIHMATANLSALSQQVNYVYDFGQLLRIEYPQNPENNVYYEYGQSGNETGRISKSQDASGVHAYEYGDMGELVKKTSTGVVPTADGEAYSFATRWQYDSWNRIRSINYPDGEVVEYDYDNGGQLIHMQGTKTNVQTYVSNIEYDEFGSRTKFEYGNGVSSSYIYNTATRRLQTLTTTATNGSLHNITYTYDPVGNITRISNSAGGADGLGGRFTYNYSYDDLYRLDSSDGNSAVNASYTLAMEYSPSGNILKKTLAATKQLLGNSTTDSYENVYSYSGAHKLEQVFEVNGLVPNRNFFFDPNGNMLYQEFFDPNSGPNNRYLCWDEENRLSATRDNNYVTANIYDASGNRAWKLAGEMNWMWQNGSGFQGYGDLNLRTWYQSELMTITDVGFTKHYFIAGQRIASKLGESLNNADVQPLRENHVAPLTENYKVLSIGAAERMKRDFECLSLDYRNFTPGEPVIRVLDELVGVSDVNEANIIFYHSDHLGSSSFLTDGGGVATQHLQYMPFGEDLVHQQNTAAYYTPYTFSGKERDMETGLSYFGARYYDAGLSIWLSVDPMSDKYPHQSPYTYCSNNPVMLFDPNGKEDYEVDKKGYMKVVKSTIGNGQPDRLIAGKAKYDKKTGELTNKASDVLTLDKGSITGNLDFEKNKEYRLEGDKTVTADMTKISNLDNKQADKVFEFLKKHTNVEIAHLHTSISNENGIVESNIIATNHLSNHEYELAGRVSQTLNLNPPGLTSMTYIHSHPFPDSWFGSASPDDEAAFKTWRNHKNASGVKLNFQVKYRGITNSY